MLKQNSDQISRSYIMLTVIEALEAEDWKLKGVFRARCAGLR